MWHVAFLTSCQMKDPVFPWTMFLYPMCLPCTYLFHSLLGSCLSQGKHVLGFCCTRLPRESTIPLENGLALSFHPWLLVVYLQPGYRIYLHCMNIISCVIFKHITYYFKEKIFFGKLSTPFHSNDYSLWYDGNVVEIALFCCLSVTSKGESA